MTNKEIDIKTAFYTGVISMLLFALSVVLYIMFESLIIMLAWNILVPTIMWLAPITYPIAITLDILVSVLFKKSCPVVTIIKRIKK